MSRDQLKTPAASAYLVKLRTPTGPLHSIVVAYSRYQAKELAIGPHAGEIGVHLMSATAIGTVDSHYVKIGVLQEVPATPLPDAYDELCNDPRLISLIQNDDDFAKEFAAAACNATWTHTETGAKIGGTFREVDAWVCELRDRPGDEDFYNVGNPGTCTPRVLAELTRLGWTWNAR